MSGLFRSLLIDQAGVWLLLSKLTVLMLVTLLLYRLSKRQTSAFRHIVLAIGLFAVPILIAAHFLLPSWRVIHLHTFIVAQATASQDNGAAERVTKADSV